MQVIRNLKIQKPYTNDNEFDVELTPGTEKIVIYKITDDDSFEY